MLVQYRQRVSRLGRAAGIDRQTAQKPPRPMPPASRQLAQAWLGLAWLGLAWLGLAWLGLAWLGLAWLGKMMLVIWVMSSVKLNIFEEANEAWILPSRTCDWDARIVVQVDLNRPNIF